MTLSVSQLQVNGIKKEFNTHTKNKEAYKERRFNGRRHQRVETENKISVSYFDSITLKKYIF